MKDKIIRLPGKVGVRLDAMQAILREMSGRPITQGETVERALACLTDAHGRNAWLSGVEAGKIMEERHQQQVLQIVGHLLARVRPDLDLQGVGFNPMTGQAHIVIRGEEAITLEDASLTTKA